MSIRHSALPLFVLLLLAPVVLLAPVARAQISVPDVTGHGSCYQAPCSEASAPAFAFDFNSFLSQRAAQIRSAAAHWLPQRGALVVSHARPASPARVAR